MVQMIQLHNLKKTNPLLISPITELQARRILDSMIALQLHIVVMIMHQVCSTTFIGEDLRLLLQTILTRQILVE